MRNLKQLRNKTLQKLPEDHSKQRVSKSDSALKFEFGKHVEHLNCGVLKTVCRKFRCMRTGGKAACTVEVAA
ncbi:Uncharacterised protein [Stutzerimonas stutzeri]|uniref:hypothetical protein n=1 Tax=Stutzerimonas stutzeri subgroup TaxID=578833 RepID=UPI000F70FDEF|nr:MULTISPECIES: hypothetical protein [Stutzerimonas stutzeri subgroup]MCQ2048788.1 hypothetical protein [Stutzerimonas kunmingensis]QQC13198.1 hypothetical protein I6I22_10490 [Stutzerimonas stutzeri]VEI35404.1 Uncharacterised protein [Stutzerimonas stutzeri]